MRPHLLRSPVGTAAAGLLAVAALLVALLALAAASGRAPTPETVVSQVKAKRCQSHQVGGIKTIDCRGPRGRRGRRGPRGHTGARGAKGNPGTPGAVAGRGPRGPKGPTGDKGPDGPPGNPGPAGANGQPGANGLPGDPGDNGDTGDRGPTNSYTVILGNDNFNGLKTVLSESIPQGGNYVVFAKGTFQNGDDDDEAAPFCNLRFSTLMNPIDSVSTTLDDNSQSGAFIDNFALQSTLSSTQNLMGGTLSLECQDPGAGERVDVNNVVLTAIKVDSVTVTP